MSCCGWWPRPRATQNTRWPRPSSTPPDPAGCRYRRRFTAVPGAGAIATVEGKRVAVGNGRLLDGEDVRLGGLSERAAAFTAEGRTVVQAAIDGHAAGVIAIADAPRGTAAAAVSALHQLGLRTVMLTGDNRVTAGRVAAEVGIEEVIAEVLPGDKA